MPSQADRNNRIRQLTGIHSNTFIFLNFCIAKTAADLILHLYGISFSIKLTLSKQSINTSVATVQIFSILGLCIEFDALNFKISTGVCDNDRFRPNACCNHFPASSRLEAVWNVEMGGVPSIYWGPAQQAWNVANIFSAMRSACLRQFIVVPSRS